MDPVAAAGRAGHRGGRSQARREPAVRAQERPARDDWHRRLLRVGDHPWERAVPLLRPCRGTRWP
eukprot:2763102-Prymnesium_polylepis.1